MSKLTEAINSQLDTLTQAIVDETAQVEAALASLGDVVTSEEGQAILDKIAASTAKIRAIVEPKE